MNNKSLSIYLTESEFIDYNPFCLHGLNADSLRDMDGIVSIQGEIKRGLVRVLIPSLRSWLLLRKSQEKPFCPNYGLNLCV
jgi:hypothetical protein